MSPPKIPPHAMQWRSAQSKHHPCDRVPSLLRNPFLRNFRRKDGKRIWRPCLPPDPKEAQAIRRKTRSSQESHSAANNGGNRSSDGAKQAWNKQKARSAIPPRLRRVASLSSPYIHLATTAISPLALRVGLTVIPRPDRARSETPSACRPRSCRAVAHQRGQTRRPVS